MANLYSYSSANKKKTWFLMTGFFVLVIAIGFVFSRALEMPGILVGAVLISIIMSFISYWYSDKMILSISGAKLVDKENGKELYRLVENLCITAGLPLPKIYIIQDPAPNAFATGRDPEHAAIAVTSGILGTLEKNELEGVIAHELSHIGNRDILISTIATILLGIVVLLADIFWRWSFFGGRRNNDEKDGRVALLISILAIAFAILAPIFAQLLQLAISRKREFAADADGALLTRYPEGLARALEKISVYEGPAVMKANKATAHMYIASPLNSGQQKKQSWFNKLWQTHPPVAERITRLRGLS